MISRRRRLRTENFRFEFETLCTEGGEHLLEGATFEAVVDGYLGDFAWSDANADTQWGRFRCQICSLHTFCPVWKSKYQGTFNCICSIAWSLRQIEGMLSP